MEHYSSILLYSEAYYALPRATCINRHGDIRVDFIAHLLVERQSADNVGSRLPLISSTITARLDTQFLQASRITFAAHVSSLGAPRMVGEIAQCDMPSLTLYRSICCKMRSCLSTV